MIQKNGSIDDTADFRIHAYRTPWFVKVVHVEHPRLT